MLKYKRKYYYNPIEIIRHYSLSYHRIDLFKEPIKSWRRYKASCKLVNIQRETRYLKDIQTRLNILSQRIQNDR